jgi:hypothetical protein
MMITIDPNELTVASDTLHSCAAEAADIGSQLWACACCVMPADVQGVIDQLVIALDRALDSVAARLDAQAVDLGNRAQIATTDSLAAAGVVVESNTITGTSPGPVTYTTIGGSSLYGDVVITTPALVDTPIAGGIGIAPGEVTITNADGSPATTPIGPFVIGPPDYSQGPLSGIMALAEASDRMRNNMQPTINTIVNNPSASAAALSAVMSTQDKMADNISTILAPSRTELEEPFGHRLPDDYISMISPHTLL